MSLEYIPHLCLNPGMEISENQKKLAMLNAQKAAHGKSKGEFQSVCVSVGIKMGRNA